MRARRLVTCSWLCLCALACTQIAGIERAHEIQSGSCNSVSECNDGELCTDDSCDGGFCAHAARADGPLPAAQQKSGDCQRVQCASGKAATVADDTDVADDGLQCTKEGCASGKATSMPLEKRAKCSDGGGKLCDGKGQCVECVDDGDCTKPNLCGSLKPGKCGCAPIPCANVGLTCGFAADDGCGKPLACNDAKQNGSETDIDCGGPIKSCSQRCNDGKKCLSDSDCASGKCDATAKICLKV